MTEETLNPAVTLKLTKEDVARAHVHVVNGVPVIARPQGWSVEVRPDLAETRFEQKDPFISETVHAADDASFLYYLEQFFDDGTQFFASTTAKQIHAALDYHTPDGASNAAHNLYRTYVIEDRFDAWRAAAGKWMTQDAFVDFLQDRTADLDTTEAAPLTQSRLLDLVRDFRATQDLTCNSALNSANGDVHLTFVKSTTQRMDVSLPERLLLALPVFKFGGIYQIQGRFKFKLTDNKVTFRFDLIRIENLIEQAFLDEVKDMEGKVKQKIVLLA